MLEALQTLIGPLSALQIAIIVLAMMAGGFLRGFVGFGGAILIILVLSAVLGPQVAVPITGLSGLPTTLQLLPVAIRESDRRFVVPVGVTAFLAAPFGALALVLVDAAVMKMVISALVIGMVVMLYRGWRFPVGGTLALAGIGGIAGVIQGVAGIGGPPIFAVALSRPDTPDRQRANVIGAVTLVSICSMPAYWYHGLFTLDVIMLSLFLFPFYVSASWVGARYFSTGGRRHFRNAALLVLAAMGALTFWLAARDVLAG